MALINQLTVCFICLTLNVFLPVKIASEGQRQLRRVCLLEVLENGYYVGPFGQVVTRRVKPGKVVEARCSPGYFLSGHPNRTCGNQTQQFLEDAPSCQACLLKVLEDGYYVGPFGQEVIGLVKPGTVVEAKCNSGYSLKGHANRTCGNQTGQFNEDAPSCQDVDECRYIPFGVTAEYSDSWVDSKSGSSFSEFTWDIDTDIPKCHDTAHCKNTPGSYECECDDGYEGDGINPCKKTVEKQCEQLEPPQHGSMTGDLKFAQFVCEEGYRISGARYRRCVDGVWRGLHPICEVIGCGKPIVPVNGYIEGSTFDVGKWVIFRCNKGYELAGNRKITCKHGDGYKFMDFWDGATPSCRSSAKTPESIAGKIKTDFIDHLEVFTESGRGRLAVSGDVGLELVFAFDRSSSLNHVNFERGINFTISLVRQFGVSYSVGGTRVAAITFASTADIEFTYGPEVDTLDKVIDRINDIKGKRGGGTALEEAFSKVFELSSVMRNGSKRALFLLTDGVVTIGDDPSASAESLRVDNGFEIFVVAIGEGIDQRQLRKIASQPYSTHIFLLKNFEDLASLTDIISEKGQEYRRCGQAGNLEIPQLSTDQDTESNANPNAWPWLAQIIQLNDTGPILKCGGAVLCEEWIVTAGSCVFNLETHTIAPEKLRVRLGAYEIGVQEKTQRDFDVKEVFLFDDYDPHNRFNDIAVIKLNQTVNLTSSIRTLCLPLGIDSLWPKSNSLCYVAGWGIIDPIKDQPRNDSMHSIYPKQLKMQLVNDDKCKIKMELPYPFNKKKMCAGYRFLEDESCQGDTGSPLVCRQIDGSWAFAGVVSYSKECMEYDKYSVFTRVDDFSTWINKLTDNCTSNYLADLTVGGFV